MRSSYLFTRNNLGRVVVSFLLILTLQIVLQRSNAAYESEFARTYDEAGHYVTGLMMRDFIAGLDWLTPMAFAEDFYLHYPKVAIGHWPPVFYLVQAGWTLLFSSSRASLMILMAIITALLGTAIYVRLEREFGRWVGLGGGLLFVALPLVQANTSVLMLDVVVALLGFLAALSYGRYLDTEGPRWAAWFSFWAILAIMTKANGLVLALVPPLSVLLTHRFHLLRRFSFWAPAVAVVVFCGPWYWLTLDMLQNGILAQSPTLGYTLAAIPQFSFFLASSVGFGLFTLAVVGLVPGLSRPLRDGALDGGWTALISLWLATLIFHWIVPAGFEARHLITALPSTICFVAAGVAYLAGRLPPSGLRPELKRVLLSVLAVGLFFLEAFSISGKPWHGYGEVAALILNEPRLESSVLLVSSGPTGEGAFVSEIAFQEIRPGHIVLRGSKALATSRWDGADYRPNFSSPEDLWEFLRETPVGVVVIDRELPRLDRTPDQSLLWETLEQTRDFWTLRATAPATRDGVAHEDTIQVYVQNGHETREVQPIRIDLTEMLGRHIGHSGDAGNSGN